MDATGAWVAFSQHKGRIGWLIVALLLFALGWQLGRVMSPYYAAQPIIFNEATASPSVTPGDPQALQALQERGIALRSPVPASAQVAGDVDVKDVKPSVAPQAKQFVASVNSTLYHYKDCPSVAQINEENKVWFATVEEAEAAGYKPSKCTKEKLQP